MFKSNAFKAFALLAALAMVVPAYAGEGKKMVSTYEVNGMTCGGCRGKLERMLREEAGVTAVTVSLEDEQASVVGSISLARVREIVESAGFEPRA